MPRLFRTICVWLVSLSALISPSAAFALTAEELKSHIGQSLERPLPITLFGPATVADLTVAPDGDGFLATFTEYRASEAEGKLAERLILRMVPDGKGWLDVSLTEVDLGGNAAGLSVQMPQFSGRWHLARQSYDSLFVTAAEISVRTGDEDSFLYTGSMTEPSFLLSRPSPDQQVVELAHTGLTSQTSGTFSGHHMLDSQSLKILVQSDGADLFGSLRNAAEIPQSADRQQYLQQFLAGLQGLLINYSAGPEAITNLSRFFSADGETEPADVTRSDLFEADLMAIRGKPFRLEVLSADWSSQDMFSARGYDELALSVSATDVDYDLVAAAIARLLYAGDPVDAEQKQALSYIALAGAFSDVDIAGSLSGGVLSPARSETPSEVPLFTLENASARFAANNMNTDQASATLSVRLEKAEVTPDKYGIAPLLPSEAIVNLEVSNVFTGLLRSLAESVADGSEIHGPLSEGIDNPGYDPVMGMVLLIANAINKQDTPVRLYDTFIQTPVLEITAEADLIPNAGNLSLAPFAALDGTFTAEITGLDALSEALSDMQPDLRGMILPVTGIVHGLGKVTGEDKRAYTATFSSEDGNSINGLPF